MRPDTRQIIATATDFDTICDAYHRRLARYEEPGPEVVRIFRLRTELDGAVVCYFDATNLVWLGACDASNPNRCGYSREGWHDERPIGPWRPLEAHA